MRNQFTNWRKSTRSGNGGNDCVEVSLSADGTMVGVRDSKDRSGPVLVFSAAAWTACLRQLGRRVGD